jgi:hypothetical protein
MNSSDSIKLIFAAIGAALVFFWEKVTYWAKESFFPFVKKHLPGILEYVQKAFTWIDNVVVSIRRGIKAAWQKVRQYLLKMAMYFEKKSSNKWVRKTTSYIIKTLESKQVTKHVVEEEINWDDLSPDIRKAWMKNTENNIEIDYTAEKDKNSDSLEMIN